MHKIFAWCDYILLKICLNMTSFFLFFANVFNNIGKFFADLSDHILNKYDS